MGPDPMMRTDAGLLRTPDGDAGRDARGPDGAPIAPDDDAGRDAGGPDEMVLVVSSVTS